MKKMKRLSVKVELNVPMGVTGAQVQDHIKNAVLAEIGYADPLDLFSDIPRDSVAVRVVHAATVLGEGK